MNLRTNGQTVTRWHCHCHFFMICSLYRYSRRTIITSMTLTCYFRKWFWLVTYASNHWPGRETTVHINYSRSDWRWLGAQQSTWLRTIFRRLRKVPYCCLSPHLFKGNVSLNLYTLMALSHLAGSILRTRNECYSSMFVLCSFYVLLLGEVRCKYIPVRR